jgi:hypothetical protein
MAQFPSKVSTPVASSLFSGFLFGKCVPKNQDADQLLLSFSQKLAAPPISSPEYLSALDSTILPRFRRGWDKEYLYEVETGILSSGKTTEGIHADEFDIPQSDFVSLATGASPIPAEAFASIKSRKAVAIEDSGKLRLVTVASKWQHLLAPLHRLIYNVLVLKTHGTVVRGTPLPSTFRSFPGAPGNCVSGDYEASTDNLSSLHSIHILETLRSRSTVVPSQIWDLAIASMTGTLTYVDSEGVRHVSEQNTGQLMGNYLSFPLLCISNMATLFLGFGVDEAERLIHQGLVRINGDDIVFVQGEELTEKWRSSLPLSGFVVNESKTSTHKYLFTLNSRLFRRGQVRVKRVWSISYKGILKKADPRKKPDVMAAHAAVIRENVQCVPGKLYPKVVRALACVKKRAWIGTSVKLLKGMSYGEFRCWPKDWKDAERIAEFERRFVPLRQKTGGYKIRNTIKRSEATKAEAKDSNRLTASVWFHKADRMQVIETNDRGLSLKEREDCMDWLYLAVPNYSRRKEESVVYLRERRVIEEETDPFGCPWAF